MSLYYPIKQTPQFVYQESIGFKTVVATSESGVEQRQSRRSQGWKLFSLVYNVEIPEDIDRLYNFYRLCRGSAVAFSFNPYLFATSPTNLLPSDQTTIWLPLHEGSGTKMDDWNGYIDPIYSCRFAEDQLSIEEFATRLQRTSLKIMQESALTLTNNYGTLIGGTWSLCPDYSSCISFNGSSDYISLGNAAAANVGTGDFSFAFCIYPNSLSSALNLMSKKTDSTTASIGYNVIVSTGGIITVLSSDGTHQDTIASAAGAIVNQTWKIIAVTIDRNGSCQIYVNGSATGSPVIGTTSNTMNNSNSLHLGHAEGIGYANCKLRNFLFAKKVWTAAELSKIYSTWRGILGI